MVPDTEERSRFAAVYHLLKVVEGKRNKTLFGALGGLDLYKGFHFSGAYSWAYQLVEVGA
jgi:hypothetical protein